MPQQNVFVGREEIVQRICDAMLEPRSLHVVEGPPGIGKTRLISYLAKNLEKRSNHVLRLDMQGFRTDIGAFGESGTSTTLQRSFDNFCDLVLVIVGWVSKKRTATRFQERVKAAKRNPIGVANANSGRTTLIIQNSQGVNIEKSLNTVQEDFGQTVHDLVHEFTVTLSELVEESARRAGGRRPCLLIDGMDTVRGDSIASWVVALAHHLRAAMVVVAGRSPMPHLTGGAHHVLDNFTHEECRRYAAAIFGTGATPALVARIHAFTSGNPQAVSILVDLVQRIGPAATMDLLRTWSGGRQTMRSPETINELVRALLTSGADPLAAEVSSALAVVRRFDQRLITRMVAEEIPAADPDKLCARVIQLPFVEPSADSSGEFNGHRLHEFVRSVLLGDFKAREPARYARLQARALVHYQQEIEKVKAGLGRQDPFLEAIRYKNVRWRHLYTEWLYHLGNVADPDERALARLLFADVYLDAFWWWGYYTPLSFCDDLLNEWALVCQDPIDHGLLAQLTRFARAFPPGWGTRDTENPEWENVTSALLWIRRLGRLDDPGTVAADANLRHLRAVTSLFIAEAAQSSGKGTDVADRWYSDSCDMFDTDMGKDWTRYQQAEMWFDAGDIDHAVGLLDGMEDSTRRRRDDELLGRIAIFTASCELARGEYVSAATYTVLSTLHAFVFHVRQTAAPDDYSTEFHRELLDKAAQLFDDIAARAGAEARRDVIVNVWRLLLPLHRQGRLPPDPPGGSSAESVSGLVRLLPQPPAPADMNDPASPYVNLIDLTKTDMSAELARSVSPTPRP